MAGGHEHVVRSFGHGSLDGEKPFVLLEFLPIRLSDAAPEIHEMTAEYQIGWAKYIIAGVSRGLEFLKEHGIVHADIKSDNIMIRHNSEPVLIDFSNSGILGTDGYIIDTLLVGGAFCYASPEMLLLMMRYYCRLNMMHDVMDIVPQDLKVLHRRIYARTGGIQTVDG